MLQYPTPRGSGKRAQPHTSPRGVGVAAARSARLVEGAPAARSVLAMAATLPAEAWARQTSKAGSQGRMVAECATMRGGAVRDT